jgi:hypothetical protein
MKYRRRIFFTDKQKSEIWDRWQRGESMSSIIRRPTMVATQGGSWNERRRSRVCEIHLHQIQQIDRSLGGQIFWSRSVSITRIATVGPV